VIPDTSRSGVKPVTRSRERVPQNVMEMPPFRPPFPGGALRNRGPVAVRPRPSQLPSAGRAPSPPRLRILVAGVDKDAKGAVEASVRHALGSQAERGPWSISVVSMAGRWSVTLDGPEERLRGLSFVVDGSRLVEAIREALDGHGATPATGAAASPAVAVTAATGPASEVHDRHACEHCGKPVLVTYEERPGEGKALAAVACPHCWTIGHVEIGAWAAAGGEYRAERG
jgi:hypothetical protein